jgi:hypothetical protein
MQDQQQLELPLAPSADYYTERTGSGVLPNEQEEETECCYTNFVDFLRSSLNDKYQQLVGQLELLESLEELIEEYENL